MIVFIGLEAYISGQRTARYDQIYAILRINAHRDRHTQPAIPLERATCFLLSTKCRISVSYCHSGGPRYMPLRQVTTSLQLMFHHMRVSTQTKAYSNRVLRQRELFVPRFEPIMGINIGPERRAS